MTHAERTNGQVSPAQTGTCATGGTNLKGTSEE